jgi:hypothetical protein
MYVQYLLYNEQYLWSKLLKVILTLQQVKTNLIITKFKVEWRSSAEAQCAIFVQQGINPLTL